MADLNEIGFEWFFKFPGLLITGGVFLILVALIVIVIGKSKDKKAAKEETNFGVDANNMKDNKENENVVTPLVNPTINTENVNITGKSDAPVNNVVENKTADKGVVAAFEPTITPVNTDVVAPTVPKEETPATPVAEASSVVTPIITPIEPVNVTPAVSEEVKTEEVKPTEIKVEEPKTDEIKPAEVQVEEPKTEEIKPTEIKVEETKPEENKVEANIEITPVVQPVVENQVAEAPETVEVNVAPPVEIQVAAPEEVKPIEIGVPDVNAEIKIEPVAVTPIEINVENQIPAVPEVNSLPEVTAVPEVTPAADVTVPTPQENVPENSVATDIEEI